MKFNHKRSIIPNISRFISHRHNRGDGRFLNRLKPLLECIILIRNLFDTEPTRKFPANTSNTSVMIWSWEAARAVGKSNFFSWFGHNLYSIKYQASPLKRKLKTASLL